MGEKNCIYPSFPYEELTTVHSKFFLVIRLFFFYLFYLYPGCPSLDLSSIMPPKEIEQIKALKLVDIFVSSINYGISEQQLIVYFINKGAKEEELTRFKNTVSDILKGRAFRFAQLQSEPQCEFSNNSTTN